MGFTKLNGGIVTKPDRRLLAPNALRTAEYVEHRPGQEGLFETATFRSVGNSSPQSGNSTTAGLIFAHYDAAGGFLISDYGTKLAEAAVATSGVTAALAQIDGEDINFVTAPKVLSGVMLAERLHVISGVNLSMGGSSTQPGNFNERNLVRQKDGVWRREGLDKPKGTYSSVNAVDVTITAVPADTPYTYRAKYLAANSDDNKVENGKLVNDTDPSSAAKIWVEHSGNTKRGVWDFSNLAESGQSAGGQPSTGKGVLSLLVAAGPREAWKEIGNGGGSGYSLDADILVEYSTTGPTGTWTTMTQKKAPFLSEWITFDFGTTTVTISSLAIRVSVTKNDGSANGTAYVGEIRFDVGGGNKSAINTDTVEGIHYLITAYSDPGKGGSGRESSPGDYGSAILFPVDGTDPKYVELPFVPTSYPNGIKQLSFPLPSSVNLDPAATDFRIYRSPNGTKQKILDRYGMIAQVPITATSFTDNFTTGSINEVTQPTVEAYFTGSGENVVFYPFNELPPVAVAQCVFKGSRVMLKRGDSDVYFTHPYNWESVPGLYRINSRSPRNDQPETVCAANEVWFIFYPDYTRRVQGLPLALDGQFNATNYAETNDVRGACGPRAVCTFARDGEEGNTWIFCVDKHGFYIRNESQLLPWSRNIIWTETDSNKPAGFAAADSTSLREVIVLHNAFLERIEVYYCPDSTDLRTFKRLDIYYNRQGVGEQPVILGPHPVGNISRVVHAYDNTGTRHSWAASSRGQTMYITGEGNLDYTGGAVTRSVITGYFPLTGEPGRDAYVKYVELYMGTTSNPNELATRWVLSRNGYEDAYTDINFQPAAPARQGVWSKAEFMSVIITDSTGGSTGYNRAEIMGLGITTHGRPDDESSSQRGRVGSNFNTSTRLRG